MDNHFPKWVSEAPFAYQPKVELPEYLRDYSQGVELIPPDDPALYDAEQEFIIANYDIFTNVGTEENPKYLSTTTVEEIEEYDRQEREGESSWFDAMEEYNKEVKSVLNKTILLRKYGYSGTKREVRDKNKLIYRTVIQQLQKLRPSLANKLVIERTIQNIKLLTNQ